MASPEIGTLDLASLERFQTELIEAGFEPWRGSRRIWIGPLANSLKDMTTAKTMRIVFVDGWPFRNPHLYVDGLDEWHLSSGGDVCLWTTGATPSEWLTVKGYMNRIDQWAKGAKSGFAPEDFALDAHLSFSKLRPDAIATVDLGALGLDGKPNGIGVISGKWKNDDHELEITSGGGAGIEGRWYYVGGVRVPPRDLEGLRDLLSPHQRNNFDRRFKAIQDHAKPRLFLIAWDRELGREALVLLASKDGNDVVAEAVEVAPTDAEVLKLRAGPDIDALATKRVVIFGLGAVGSNTILRLAEVGLGYMVLVDNARLRPGDIVRHAAGSWAVGDSKVSAVRFLAHARAPWSTVSTVDRSPWNPNEIAALIEEANLVIDATGFASFANLMSEMCAEKSVGLVSATLYRGGAVARVRRQAMPPDVRISERIGDGRYVTIPVGDEPRVFEPGCSSPVNNASPIAVASVAALTADLAVDFLVGRHLYPDEIVEVYRPLEDAPFNQLGRVMR